MRIESTTCDYGPQVVSVIGNTITNNTASADGGGLFVRAGVDGSNCQVHPVSVLIEDNTLTGNSAGA